MTVLIISTTNIMAHIFLKIIQNLVGTWILLLLTTFFRTFSRIDCSVADFSPL